MATAMERKLGEMLVKDKVISPEELDNAIKQQEASRRSLGHILIELGLTSEWEMAAALGKQLNVPFITLSHYEIDEQVLNTIPREIVRKYKIVPVDKTGDTLTIALSDPSNIYLLDELKLLTRTEIIPVISFESDIMEAIGRYYPDTGVPTGMAIDEALKEIQDADVKTAIADALKFEELNIEAGGDAAEDNEEGAAVNDAPVIQLVNMIISEAIKSGASDIHIEPYEKKLRLRYRIDGKLHEMTNPPKKFQAAIISRIKILSELDIAERRKPQDGRFRVKIQNRPIDFRVSSCPTVHGEKVVMRILDAGNLMLNLEDLGFEPQVKEKFEKAILSPYGMCLITGPTGSGKSTTLAGMIDYINETRQDHILTIEDPIEFVHEHKKCIVNQREVGPNTRSFAAALRSALREDPDVILVGELRDLETISLAMTAAETGHLVFGTLHTQSAPKTCDRVIDVFPPEQQKLVRIMFAESFQAIVCQTLIPKRSGDGRVCAMEIMIGTAASRSLIREGKTHQLTTIIQTSAKVGMQSLDQHLKDLLMRKVIDETQALMKANNPDYVLAGGESMLEAMEGGGAKPRPSFPFGASSGAPAPPPPSLGTGAPAWRPAAPASQPANPKPSFPFGQKKT